ncbi:DUF6297 family protein [Streptomyces sp. XM4193]|uniref:DUF6297 family protein n=1 Tax=Streptomyces sp. XM4193 TaxID=2929782 RepID=UPI001FFAD20E|nr:DUF6297 family protein [Streptomyces sp. XM4193]MCK1795684.1 DUF6297 family protein [Streptomyces sp. XM4193]
MTDRPVAPPPAPDADPHVTADPGPHTARATASASATDTADTTATATATGSVGALPDTDPRPAVDSSEFALAYLRVLRRGQRRQDARSTLYVVYCLAVFTAIWAVPYLAAAATAAHNGAARGPFAERTLAVLPSLAVVVTALVLLSGARSACWRGPVLLSRPDAAWLLPHPIVRARLLLPVLRRAALIAGSGGAALGAMTGFALQAATATPWWATTSAGLWWGAVTGLLCTAVRVWVQRRQQRLTRAGAREFTLWRAGAVLLAAAAGLVAWAQLAPGGPDWPATLLVWSGPWAWPALPLVAAAGQFGGAVAWWTAAAGVLLSGATLALLGGWALRDAPRTPARVLRLQSRQAHQVTAALYSFDLGGARRLTSGVHRRAPVRWRPAPPRARWLLVPWRDLLALLRAPGRMTGALLWALAATASARFAAETSDELRVLATASALALLCRAAGRAAVGAELDGADPARCGQLPWPRSRLALRHALLPIAVLGLAVAAGTALLAVTTGPHPSTLALLAAVPACTAAAVAGAYRGQMPTHLLIGTDTAMGNTGALNVLLWHCRAPLVLLLFATPAHPLLPHPYALLWFGALTAGLLWWALVRARRR